MTSMARQDGELWPQRPAIRARYDAAAGTAGYGDLEEVLADLELTAADVGDRLGGVSAQTVGIMRRQRRLRRPRKQPEREPEPVVATDRALARLRLRRLLRQAREAAGLTQAQVADALAVSASKVVRAESGQVRPSVLDVRAMLALYGATERLAEAEQLATAAKGPSWTSDLREVLSPGDIACWTLEPHAAVAHHVDLFGIPALLRTEEFARRYVGGRLSPLREVARAELLVRAWMRRQRLLDDPPLMRFYLDESAWHRGRGDPVMVRQWQHTRRLAEHPKVDIAVIPYGAGLPPTVCSFTILELPDPPEALVYAEDQHSGSLVQQEQPGDLAYWRDRLAWFEKEAVPLGEVVDWSALG